MILFNYIFSFYSGGKKIKEANYKTATINKIIIHLNQKVMEQIKNAILEGQRNVIVNGILFEGLPILPRDTQKNKEKFAEARAKELIKLIE